jgi:hypothetical protein
MIQGIDPFGVIVYHYTGGDRNHYINGIYTGIYGQCVEYVRRWLIHMFGLTFESIPRAVDLIHVEYLYSITPFRLVPLRTVMNGSGPLPPCGSILVFKQSGVYPDGHVALVMGVDRQRVYISEQNYATKKWTRRYSRTIPVHGSYVMDEDCIGWKIVAK